MLTIRQHSSGAYFNNDTYGSGNFFGPVGLDGVPIPGTALVQSFPCGTIATSREKTFGEHNVHHDQLEGELLVDSEYDQPYNSDFPTRPITYRRLKDQSGTILPYRLLCPYRECVSEITVYRYGVPPLEGTSAICASFNFGMWTKEFAFEAWHELVLKDPDRNLPSFLAKLRTGVWDKTLSPNQAVVGSLYIPNNPDNWLAGGKSYRLVTGIFAPQISKFFTEKGAESYINELIAKRSTYFKTTYNVVRPTVKPHWFNIPIVPKLDNRELRQLSNFLFKTVPSPTSAGHPLDVWGALVTRIVDKSRSVDINSIAFLADFAKIRDLLPPIPKGSGGVANPKYLSKVFLWWNYGVKTTFRDVCSLSESLYTKRSTILSELPYQTLRAKIADSVDTITGPVAREYHAKLLFSRYPQAFMVARTHLDSLGLYPNLVRSWDLIPFSFVLDWILPISDILDKADKNADIQYFDVWSYTKSYKLSRSLLVRSLQTQGITLSGSITRVVYDRRTQKHLDIPKLEAEFPSVDPMKHWAEATALLVSARR